MHNHGTLWALREHDEHIHVVPTSLRGNTYHLNRTALCGTKPPIGAPWFQWLPQSTASTIKNHRFCGACYTAKRAAAKVNNV